ncbi:MAG: tolB [Acidobacteriaceae bacterium]|nr:tolB [Acidobacteriaceae bacterium]
MILRLRRACAIVLSIALISASLPLAAIAAPSSADVQKGVNTNGKRLITEKDIFEFNWTANPQISPDGSQVVFVRVKVNDKKDGYETSLWAVSTRGDEQPHRLTNGPRDSSPRWSPDGKRLAFVRVAEKDGKPQQGQIYVLNFNGGEPWALTSLAKGASSPKWSPDGSRIAFISSTTAAEMAKAGKDKKPEETKDKSEKAEQNPPEPKSQESKAEERASKEGKPTPAKPESETKPQAAGKDEKPEHESDVRVISRAVYRENGEGYMDPKHPDHIWVIGVPAAVDDAPLPTPQQLTSGGYDDSDAMWSPDGSQILFTSDHTPEPYYEVARGTVYSVPSNGGAVKKLFTVESDIGSPSLSKDGKQITYRGSANKPILSYAQDDLWVIDAAPGAKPRNLTADFDYDIGSGPGGDQHPPRAGGRTNPIWSSDGHSIVDVVLQKGVSNLYRFDTATGKATPLTNGNHDAFSFTSSADGSKLAMVISTPTNIGDVFVADASGNLKQLTHVNEKLFSQIKLTEPEQIWYTSFDGRKIEAWVQKPPDFDAKKKYPLILNIHGGPHSAYGYTFDHEFQWMAAKGYVVLYPNPRGSTSYGQEFGNIIQHAYPGDDYKDLMIGVDELLKRGYVDEKRMGVTGGSGGGVLTNWTIGQTDRFAAAVSQRSIADWSSWWYTADFTLFQPSWFKGAPFEDKVDFVARSPITYIQRVKTPLMLIEGESDYRTPPTSGGEQMFRALKYLKKPVVMVRFPEETHELSRSCKPWHRVERLEHIVNWFDIYLMGKKIAGYDPNPEAEAPSKAEE